MSATSELLTEPSLFRSSTAKDSRILCSRAGFKRLNGSFGLVWVCRARGVLVFDVVVDGTGLVVVVLVSVVRGE